MSTERGGPALPELRGMLGRAVAEQNAHRSATEGPRQARRGRAPLKARLVLPLAVVGTIGALAVGAGAAGLIPIAPQLSSQESGVKPDVVPGETQIIESSDGQRVEATVSPCIKSDPKGYSNAELTDPEWCFHAPGAGTTAPNAKKEHVYKSGSNAWQRE